MDPFVFVPMVGIGRASRFSRLRSGVVSSVRIRDGSLKAGCRQSSLLAFSVAETPQEDLMGRTRRRDQSAFPVFTPWLTFTTPPNPATSPGGKLATLKIGRRRVHLTSTPVDDWNMLLQLAVLRSADNNWFGQPAPRAPAIRENDAT